MSTLGLAAGAVSVGIAASGGRARELDERWFRRINGVGSPAVDALAAGVTEFGSIWASVGAAAVLALAGHRRVAGRALAAACATWLAGQGLKRLFDRPRPYHADPSETRLLIGEPLATSYPSSHPAVVLTFVTVAGRGLHLGRGERTALVGLAGLVGLSRVLVGVHYPGDVVGGLMFGLAVADAVSAGASPTPASA